MHGRRGSHASAAWLPAQRKALFRQLTLVRFEPALEQSHQIATGQTMPRKPAHPLEQLAKLTICREMHAVAIRGQGFESTWFRRLGRPQCAQRGRWFACTRLDECFLQRGQRLARRRLRWHLLGSTVLGSTLDVESKPRLCWHPSGYREARQATHQIAHIGPGKARREQLLHLPRTAMRTQLEQLRGVLRSQVLPQRRSVQCAARHQRENLRMIAAHPRRRDVPTRRRLTQPEFLHAIFEQRRKPEIEKQLPLVQLRQVRQKLSRDLVAPPDDARKPRQKLVAARTRPVAQT